MEQLFDQYGTPLKVGQKVAVARQNHIAVGQVREIRLGYEMIDSAVFVQLEYPIGTSRPDVCIHYRRDAEGSQKYMTEILVLGE